MHGLALPSKFELSADAPVVEGVRRDILTGGRSLKAKAKAEAEPKATARRTYVDA